MPSPEAVELYPYNPESPEVLAQARRRLDDVAALLSDVGADVDDKALQLEASWESTTATRAVADTRTLAGLLPSDARQLHAGGTALGHYVTAIDDCRERIDKIRTKYDEAVADRDYANAHIDPRLKNRGPRDDVRQGNQHQLDERKQQLDREHADALADLKDASATALTALTAVLNYLAPILMRPATEGYGRAGFGSVFSQLSLVRDVHGSESPARRAAQVRAFEQTFGRPPAGPSDWRTAAMLDPTSYLEKNGGVNAVVKVGRITPHPGMGTVRIGLYIPSAEVFNVPDYDLGDDRGPDSQFDPERTRVTLYIDYETGVVIARQNPSVNTAGEVQVKTPSIGVQELDDGSVRIQYDAENPFAPPDPTDSHTVRGDIAVRPPDVPGGRWHLDGSIGDYPQFEAYQDDPTTGQTQTLDRDAADNQGELGPLLELPGHHDIGEGQGPLYRFRTRRALSGPYYEYLPMVPYGLGDPDHPTTIKPMPEYNDSTKTTRVYSA